MPPHNSPMTRRYLATSRVICGC
uniref:Uncharacterized protein n=1 Tax=Arundo donax TaxID=35708 RepID=A0A0A9C5Y3_ARUDO